MGKVYESDVDADEFIRSFREESSGLSSLKKKDKTDTEEETLQSEQPSPSTTQSTPKVRVKKEDEERFSEKFVRNMEHMRPITKYLMVEINPDFIRKIRRILSYENGPVCSVKAYVNNVLAEHFKEYEEIVKKRL